MELFFVNNHSMIGTLGILRMLSNICDGMFYKKQLPSLQLVKILPLKNFLYFYLKNSLWKNFGYFLRKKPHPENISQKKAFLIFQETKTLKTTSYIFSIVSFSYNLESRNSQKKFLIFQKIEPSFFIGKEYSEPWHNETFLILQ